MTGLNFTNAVHFFINMEVYRVKAKFVHGKKSSARGEHCEDLCLEQGPFG